MNITWLTNFWHEALRHLPFRARLCGCCKRPWNPISSWWTRQLVQIQAELPLVFHIFHHDLPWFHTSEMFRHVDSCKKCPAFHHLMIFVWFLVAWVADPSPIFWVGWRQGYRWFLAIMHAIDATLLVLTFSSNCQTYSHSGKETTSSSCRHSKEEK